MDQRNMSMSIPLISDDIYVDAQVCKQRKANFLSRLFFCQMYPLIKKATTCTLELEMLPELDFQDTSEQFYYRFQRFFDESKSSSHALTLGLLKTFKWELCSSFSVLFVQLTIDMLTPLFIKAVIDYIQQPHKEVADGVRIVLLIFGCRFVSTLLSNHNINKLRQIGNDSNAAISMALMGKCFKVSLQSNKQHKSGQVMNLMQVDSRKVQMMAFQLRGILFMPIQIGSTLQYILGVSIYMMFNFIGISFLAGTGVIILTTIANLKVGRILQLGQKVLMIAKDKRTKAANELFFSIKFIKMNALEDFFIKRLTELRDKEMAILMRRFAFQSLNIMSSWISPVLVVNATFAMYILMGNNLNPGNAFAMISLFQVLSGPLMALPMIINSLIEAMISMKRIQKFLLTNELMLDCIDQQEFQGPQQVAIGIYRGNFYWKRRGEKDNDDEESKQPKRKLKTVPEQIRPPKGQAERTQSIISERTLSTSLISSKVGIADEESAQPFIPILRDINLEIKQGELVAIVGDVGSGKTSLLSALIGEMIYEESGSTTPSIKIQGSIAYVSQKTWIQNATVKDNILFGQPYDERKYHDALMYSCLTPDLEILVNGDQTMIGEKGVNLSGGQKARISLARAIYSEGDIYLLDDPISAVDVHVGKFIMHKCLQGLLKNKTRLLVTHALNYCQYVDRVLLMEGGQIVESGTFAEICQNQRFQRIYTKFYSKVEEEEKEIDEIDEIDEQELEVKLEKQLSIAKQASKSAEKPHKLEMKNYEDKIDKLMLEEERKQGSVEFKTFLLYFKLTGGTIKHNYTGWKFFTFISLVQGLWLFSRIASSIWLAWWTEDSSTDPNLNNIFYLEVYSSFTLLFGLTAFLRAFYISTNNAQFANKIHNKMAKYTFDVSFSCLAYAPLCQFFERVPLGRIMNRFTKDQNVLDSEIDWYVSVLYVQVALLLNNTFLNVYGSTIFMVFPIIAYFIFAWYLYRFYMHANRDLYRLESITKSPILSFFGESLQGLPVIRAFGKSQSFLKTHGLNQDLNRKVYVSQNLCGMWFGLTISLCSFVVNITAIIFCIFYSNKNPAFAGLLMTYASSLDSNIQLVIQQIAGLETAIISFERCLHYTEVEPEPGYKDLVDSKINGTVYDEASKYINHWPTRGEITYDDYSVQYREGLPPALQGMKLQILPNEKIGVVGRTGAGKSTMTLTLLRVLEAMQGRILIDGINIAHLSLKQLRESITMIMQDATIFEGTIRDNIDPLQQHSDQALIDVLESCCLTELIGKREGLNTKVTENGENLSAGEKQLVCIARAVLKKSKIVLIDEATANIDIQTEQTIQQTIQRGFQNCTVITIAHRINTILNSDKQANYETPRILVIDQGAVKEFGPTQDLIKDTSSSFYAIYQEALQQQKNI